MHIKSFWEAYHQNTVAGIYGDYDYITRFKDDFEYYITQYNAYGCIIDDDLLSYVMETSYDVPDGADIRMEFLNSFFNLCHSTFTSYIYNNMGLYNYDYIKLTNNRNFVVLHLTNNDPNY